MYHPKETQSTWLARFFTKRTDGIAFIYGTALRNLSIALAIAMTVFGKSGSEVALLISLGFIIQAQMAAWHVKWINRLLPEKPMNIILADDTPRV
jgi:ACR3 family arsenite transporter